MKNNFDRILSSEDVMRRRATFLQRIHVDGPLLVLLLTLATGSLLAGLERIDRAALKARRRLTLPFVQAVLMPPAAAPQDAPQDD